MKLPLYRLGNLCGILAPVLWASAIVLCGSLRPGYSHVAQYISELGERGSSTELIMRYAGFVPAGLLHIGFAAYLYVLFRGNRLAAIGAALLAMNGVARMSAGMFPCEAGCVATELITGKLHSLSAGVGFFALIAAAVVWGFVFRRVQDLRGLGRYSIVSALLGLAFLVLMSWSPAPGTATGLYERLSSGVLSLWVLVLAVQLWLREGPAS